MRNWSSGESIYLELEGKEWGSLKVIAKTGSEQKKDHHLTPRERSVTENLAPKLSSVN